MTAAARPQTGPRTLLLVARMLWATIAAVTLALVLLGVPALFERLLTTADPRAIEDLNLTLPRYATYLTTLNLIVVLAHFVIAAIVYWRRSDDWLALFAAFTLVTNGALIPLTLMYPEGTALLDVRLDTMITAIGLVFGVVLLYIFPDGRFVPSWTRGMALGWAILILGSIFAPQSQLSVTNWPFALQFAVLLIWSGSGVFAQIYRYAYISSPTQRQQTKWAILGICLAALGPFGYFMPYLVLPFIDLPEIPNILYQRIGPELFTYSVVFQLGGWSLYTVVLLIFPLSFVVAILRYRLWDIDVLINRTLVYLSLTGSLALVYLASVVILQRLFPLESEVAVVASTLAIAAVFSPLRVRLQRAIDRRFYRRKYDIEQILAAFSFRLRDQLNLDELSQTLVAVVGETMQPSIVTLWLKDVQRRSTSRDRQAPADDPERAAKSEPGDDR